MIGPGSRREHAVFLRLTPVAAPDSIVTMTDMHVSGRRFGVIAYAIVAYLAFLSVVLWAIAFLANIDVAPTVDGRRGGSAWVAVPIDATLLLLFAVQHSVMARAGFKRWLARVLPVAAERSTYVLAASLLLGLLFGQWRTIPTTVWRVGQPAATAAIWTVYAIGWVIAIGATFMVDHLDFSGLRQASWPSRPAPYESPSFTTRWLYGFVRHPMMLGLLIVFWATPRMTVGHVFFAAAGAAYIAVGVRFEEGDLRRQLGHVYVEYARQVPAIVPPIVPARLGSTRRSSASTTVIRDRDRCGSSMARKP